MERERARRESDGDGSCRGLGEKVHFLVFFCYFPISAPAQPQAARAGHSTGSLVSRRGIFLLTFSDDASLVRSGARDWMASAGGIC